MKQSKAKTVSKAGRSHLTLSSSFEKPARLRTADIYRWIHNKNVLRNTTSTTNNISRHTRHPPLDSVQLSAAQHSLVPPLGFQWSGCSDNLSYGVAFSQTFVDEPERAKGLSAGRPIMNLHNNEAGRKVGARRFIIIIVWRLKMCHWPFLRLLSAALPGYPAQHAAGV